MSLFILSEKEPSQGVELGVSQLDLLLEVLYGEYAREVRDMLGSCDNTIAHSLDMSAHLSSEVDSGVLIPDPSHQQLFKTGGWREST